jgi:hypothetical protein
MEEVHVYLVPSGNLKEAVNSEHVDGLGISVVSTSLKITDVECGDSILIRLSGVAVMAVAEYMEVGVAHYMKVLRTLWLSYRMEVIISWKRVAEILTVSLVPKDTLR